MILPKIVPTGDIFVGEGFTILKKSQTRYLKTITDKLISNSSNAIK